MAKRLNGLALEVKRLADKLGIVNQPDFAKLNDTTLGYMLVSMRHIEDERTNDETNDTRNQA